MSTSPSSSIVDHMFRKALLLKDKAAATPRGHRSELLERTCEILNNARRLAQDTLAAAPHSIATKCREIDYELHCLAALKAEEKAPGYDRLILFGSDCPQCGAPSLIVRSRRGGILSQNCLGNLRASQGKGTNHRPRGVKLDDLPPVSCGSCNTLMKAGQGKSSNYTYECPTCARSSEVHTLVRSWDELFPYNPLGWACSSCGTFILGSLTCPRCGR